MPTTPVLTWHHLTILTICLLGVVLTDPPPLNTIEDRGDIIVQLFQWPYKEVAKECQQLNSTKAIRAVQVMAPQEHRVIYRPMDDRQVKRPWWERYQPVSFNLGNTRGGTYDDFTRMVKECRGYGIEVYVEIVVNHLAASTSGTGRGTDGTWYTFDKNTFHYTNPLNKTTPAPPTEAVLDGKKICPTASGLVTNDAYPDDCHPTLAYSTEGVPLVKLNLTNKWVQDKINASLDQLAAKGVTGFCVVSAGFSTVNDLTALFGSSLENGLFVYLEIFAESKVLQKYAKTNFTVFGLPFTQNIATALRTGAKIDENGVPTLEHIEGIFLNLATASAPDMREESSSGVSFITALTHHEKLHAKPVASFTANYSALDDVSDDDWSTAQFFLLLSLPSYGIPRLVSDYEVAAADGWANGPPVSDNVSYAIRAPSEQATVTDSRKWKNGHNDIFVMKLMKLRQELYWKNQETDSQGKFSDNYRGIDSVTLMQSSLNSSPFPVMLYVFRKIPQATSSERETCTVAFALVATHSPPVGRSADIFISNGTYEGRFEELVALKDSETGPASVCNDKIISDKVLPITLNVCLTFRTTMSVKEPTEDVPYSVPITTFTMVVPSEMDNIRARVLVFTHEYTASSELCGAERSSDEAE